MKNLFLLATGALLASCAKPTPAPVYPITGLWTQVSHQTVYADGRPAQAHAPGVFTLELKADGAFVDDWRATGSTSPFVATGTYSFEGTTLRTTYDAPYAFIVVESQVSELSAHAMTRTTRSGGGLTGSVATTQVIKYSR